MGVRAWTSKVGSVLLRYNDSGASSVIYVPRERYVHCYQHPWSKEGQFFWTSRKGGCTNELTAYVGDVLVFKYSKYQQVWKIPGPDCPESSLGGATANGAALVGDFSSGGGEQGDTTWKNVVRYHVTEVGSLYFAGADAVCRGKTNSDGSVSSLRMKIEVVNATVDVVAPPGGVHVQRLSGVVGLLQVPDHERPVVDETTLKIRNGQIRALDLVRLQQLSAASQNVLLLEMSHALSLRVDALAQVGVGPVGAFIGHSDNGTSNHQYTPRERYVHCFKNPWSQQGQNFWTPSKRDPHWGCTNNFTAYVGDVLVFKYSKYQQVWKIPSPTCPEPSLADAAGSLLIGTSDTGGGSADETNWPNVARYLLTRPGIFYFVGRDSSCRGVTDSSGSVSRLKVKVEVIAPTSEVVAGSEGDEAASSKTVQQLTGVVQALGRTSAVLQGSVEQLVRSNGGSGITQVRNYVGGLEAYHEASYTSWGVAAIHEHANYPDMAGIGEFGAVLNGVSFRTRHNDYRFRMPAQTGAKYHATEPVPMPAVPPAVLAQPTMAKQIEEMREWFRAFHEQNYTIRDYRPFFKATLCYLEGAWIAATANIAEPFASHRHKIDAETWHELHDTMRFLTNSGRKNSLENIPFLPSAVRRMRHNDSHPEIANFEYRIACHPLKEDLPTSRFRVAPDLHSQLFAQYRTSKHVRDSRQARFEVHPATSDVYVDGTDGRPPTAWPSGLLQYSFLDELMEQIPGKDGYGANLTDSSLGETCSHIRRRGEPLNVAYYSRYYSTDRKDAMGRDIRKRGFNDPHLWAAMTTRARVSALGIEGDGGAAEQRWSWAIPLEVVYLTPLSAWNPYGLPYCEQANAFITANCVHVKEDGKRTGGFTPSSAYNGTSTSTYFHTPEEFFSGAPLDDKDPADTSADVVGVLDSDSGTVYRVMASGTQTLLPDIAGVGRVRLRYPIMPIHKHGSTEWKEIKALEDIIRTAHGSRNHEMDFVHDDVFGVTLLMSMGSGHQHSLFITPSLLEQFETSDTVTVWSSKADGHWHEVRLKRNTDGSFTMVLCDPPNDVATCKDGHQSVTQITT